MYKTKAQMYYLDPVEPQPTNRLVPGTDTSLQTEKFFAFVP